jgi:malonate decarboxylase alpha subunit
VLPRVDIPAIGLTLSWVIAVHRTTFSLAIPRKFRNQVLGMMAIKGIYTRHTVCSGSIHGIGFCAANHSSLRLLYRPMQSHWGLKGKICKHWALNAHPATIPAIKGGLDFHPLFRFQS